MKKIVLVCNGGMSTAMLAKRMREASEEELDIAAYGEVEFLEYIEGASVILVGPQLRFRIPDFKKETDIPIVGISPQRYGLMDGKGVLKDIQEYL
jgi:cellobiose PTS system EIIB component